ncbi:MAG: nitroreductase [Chloroflexi bacterium]|nr:nitroreductase [Chloroflexota bacterium]
MAVNRAGVKAFGRMLRATAYHGPALGGGMTRTVTQVQETRPLLDTLTAIRTRRAVKEYVETPLPKAWIEELLDAAHWAPNHRLTHPWRFHVFLGEGRERLVSARQAAVRWRFEREGKTVTVQDMEFARTKCYSSPAIIIVSVVGADDPIIDRENYAACWCAIQNLLLAATARGLGSYPSTGDWIDENFVGPILGLSENERPVACIFLGYSEQPTMAKRLPVDRHTFWHTDA